MTIQPGSLMLLKIKDQDKFTTIGGLKATKFILNNQVIDVTHKDSGAWRELLSMAGSKYITISGAGIFTDGAAERKLRQIAFNNELCFYQICFGNKDKLFGQFLISCYERVGNMNEEENYMITLESSGEVHYESA